MGSPPKTAEEWQRQIDAQREQNIAWVSNIGIFMVRTDAVLHELKDMQRELKDSHRDITRLLTRLVEREETNGTRND